MKIEQEDFDKLPQLDRIEYRQGVIMIMILYLALLGLAFVSTLFYIDYAIKYAMLGLPSLYLGSMLFLFFVIFLIITAMLLNNYHITRLKNKFFDTEVKVKPNNKR